MKRGGAWGVEERGAYGEVEERAASMEERDKTRRGTVTKNLLDEPHSAHAIFITHSNEPRYP